jgi:hypothetical protein
MWRIARLLVSLLFLISDFLLFLGVAGPCMYLHLHLLHAPWIWIPYVRVPGGVGWRIPIP